MSGGSHAINTAVEFIIELLVITGAADGATLKSQVHKKL